MLEVIGLCVKVTISRFSPAFMTGALATDGAAGSGGSSLGVQSCLTVRSGAPSARVSHRHERVSDGIASRASLRPLCGVVGGESTPRREDSAG